VKFPKPNDTAGWEIMLLPYTNPLYTYLFDTSASKLKLISFKVLSSVSGGAVKSSVKGISRAAKRKYFISLRFLFHHKDAKYYKVPGFFFAKKSVSSCFKINHAKNMSEKPNDGFYGII
jgi:hypothetical protein